MFAASALPLLASRAAALKAGKRGELTIDGVVCEPSRFVHPGQVVGVLPSTRPLPPPWRETLPVLYEDESIAAVLKPPGVVVRGNAARTIQRALAYNLRPSTRPDALRGPEAVHRLDAPTGGVLLAAKTGSAMADLGRQFEERQITKVYRAIVAGHLEGEGVIDAPVEEREARTRWEVTEHTPHPWLVEVTSVTLHPETGRTHQLRRHMASLGHPIVGDRIHGREACLGHRRGLLLWAISLTITHPDTGERLTIACDEPERFVAFRARSARRAVGASDPVTDAPPPPDDASAD